MRPTVKVSAIGSTTQLKAALKQLSKARVLVGIPEDKNDRQNSPVTNAALMYLHTNGSELQGIPARPVIEPAIQAPDNKVLIAEPLGEAAKAVLDDKRAQASSELKRAGILGSNAAKRWFTDARNGWASNSPATIARKGSERPLIDTAQLRRSITYIVEE